MKNFAFVNEAAEKEYRNLPRAIQRQFGASLSQIQFDDRPFVDLAPLNSVGQGVYELKIQGSPAWRCVYIAKFAETVFVLHSFPKTTNGTDKKAIKTCQLRYKELIKQLKGK